MRRLLRQAVSQPCQLLLPVAGMVLPLVLAACGSRQVIVVTATVPVGTPYQAQQALTPADFALTLTDMPRDFIETIARYHSNANVAAEYGLNAADLRRRGRVTSFETQFKRQASSGLISLDDVVAKWHTPAGAAWDFHHVIRGIRSEVPLADIRAVPAPELGDAHFAVRFHTSNQPANLRDYAIVFQRGSYRVYVQAVSVTGTTTSASVLRWARIIDNRILAAG